MSSSAASSPEPPPRAAAVVVAGGSGRRMGGGAVRKQYLELLGEPILRRAILPFVEHPAVETVVVVLPPEDVAAPPAWLRDLPVSLAPGGAERGDSVRSGLDALPADTRVVLIHDAARPLVTREVVDRVLAAAVHGPALAAVPAVDTLKLADEEGRVSATLDRSRIWHAQTPQGFPLPLIRELHRRAAAEGWSATDDAALCERYGVPVRLVEGSADNLKVTRPADLVLAEALARRLRAP